MIKRLFDIVFSGIMLVLFAPLFLVLALCIALDSKGGVLFGQERVGLNGQLFKLWKFRTMHPQAEQKGQLTVGSADKRITRAGYYLRKYKVDELPQLCVRELPITLPFAILKKAICWHLQLIRRKPTFTLLCRPNFS